MMKQILRAEPKLKAPAFDVLLPITLPIAGCFLCAYMLFFIRPIFPASAPILSSTGNRISTGLWAFAWKCARDTSMCMIDKVSVWFAAIDSMAFNASKRKVPAWAPKKMICLCPPHFVSTGVILYCASFSSILSYTPRSRRYFNSSSRALRNACHSSSLPVMSSKYMTSCSFSSTGLS